MKIVGYGDRLSVQQGETVRFMVSCRTDAYRAGIVRLIHGDDNPKGPGVKSEPVAAPANGRYPGRVQPFHRGSYLVVPDPSVLDFTGGFTFQAWIRPTMPEKAGQGILTQWSESDHAGYGLFLDGDRGLSLWFGDGDGRVEKFRTGTPLTASQWYFVAATWDAAERSVRLYQEPVTTWPLDRSGAVASATAGRAGIVARPFPLLMGACWKRPDGSRAQVAGHFNGKIDGPCLYGRALESADVEGLKGGAAPGDVDEALLAAWDFSLGPSGRKVIDTGPHGLHGQTVNLPARAVTGHNWTGNEVDFKAAPGEYGAIHFHDDDLEDAGWEVDFEFEVPSDLRSGVYAARLTASDAEDHIPFFVRPRRGTATADIAFLAPTFSYLAYANQKFNNPDRMAVKGLEPGSSRPQDQFIVNERLHSLYDLHTDGSCAHYSSRLKPIVNMRPEHRLPPLSLGAGSPHQLSGDLHLVDWLEANSYRYDVITDEDLHHEGVELLSPYRVVLTGSHPEYWTRQMIAGLQAYQARGGRFMYLGGNGFYWVTAVDPERPHVIEVRRWGGSRSCEAEHGQYYHSTTGELGGLWRYQNRGPQKLVGVGMTSQGAGSGRPYRRRTGSFDPRAAFIFEGIGEDDLIGDFESLAFRYGAAGFELDRFDLALGSPAHALVLASSFGHSDGYECVMEDLQNLTGPLFGDKSPLIRSDMVYFEGPRGGAVFSVGSIAWCGSLSYNGYDNAVSRITGNVLRRFASDEPL
ncbi:MAG: LamG domain-containing protein [Acidobacteriota bacterium]|nr:LamG domain-containing protein [Acidobacteriota bacterium]